MRYEGGRTKDGTWWSKEICENDAERRWRGRINRADYVLRRLYREFYEVTESFRHKMDPDTREQIYQYVILLNDARAALVHDRPEGRFAPEHLSPDEKRWGSESFLESFQVPSEPGAPR